MKKTIETFKQAKQNSKKLTMLTAYDYSMAKLIDECGVDSILVGDSLGMVCLGQKNTLSVTMEDMIHHTKAVASGVKEALIIGDMPFMSYHTSVYDAVKNAGRLIQEGGAEAIKLEGGENVLEQVHAIVDAQIPVIGHIGLTPQSVNMFGGFKVQGKELETAKKIVEHAKRLEDAGAFAIVLECVPHKLAAHITEQVSIPTIGIGAGADCDGQVLVYQDMLSMTSGFTPKFSKVFADVGSLMRTGIRQYIEEVDSGVFPAQEHVFSINDEVLNKLY
jgi:3-methyl-2-oxobutanoate hydroxymethyltransferase